MAKIKLGKKEYTDLLIAERKLADVLGELDVAEDCGIECQEMRSIIQQNLELIAKLKAAYAPAGATQQ